MRGPVPALFLLCAALLAAGGPAAAAGKRGEDPRERQAVLAKLVKEVKRGNPQAMFLLGVLYAEGREVPRDDKRAFEVFGRAAQAGHAGAQGMLAVFHAQGRATERSDARSIEWARRAAENGDALSQYMLGLRSREGWGVPKSMPNAALWFTSAAQQNYALAQYSLGTLIGTQAGGDNAAGARESRVEAAKWLLLAQRQSGADLPDAGRQLEVLKNRMAQDEVREAGARADTWQPLGKAAQRIASGQQEARN